MQEPTVGRIVHYYDEDGAGPIAAIVTHVVDAARGVVHLTTFAPFGTGPREHHAVERRIPPATNAWDWPPRV